MTDIQKILEEAVSTQSAAEWEGTFEEYLGIVTANPAVARLSHARLYDMVRRTGCRPGPEGVSKYGLFAGEIFGRDGALDRLVQYLHSAAGNIEVRRRILLLMGPAGSGKSSIIDLLKRGLERYTDTGEGATYAIVGCPLHEEPLHLIPQEERHRLTQEYGPQVDGDLCAKCRHSLQHGYGGIIGKVKVKQVTLSRSRGVGVGSYAATSVELQGNPEVSRSSGEHTEAPGTDDGLDAELQSSNRGIMELDEIFKSDKRLLDVLHAATEAQTLKLAVNGSASIDEVIVAQSGLAKYNAFAETNQASALLDRLIVVKVPYNLRVSDEVALYTSKLSAGRHGYHSEDPRADIAPLTLHVAAVLSVLSRLEPGKRRSKPGRVSLLEKLRMYDGRVLPPYFAADVESLRASCPNEGMSGISPRYVINRLADAQARAGNCLTPSKALRSLVEGLDERAGITVEERARISSLAEMAIREYEDLAVREVQRAATDDCRAKVEQVFQGYVREVDRYCGDEGTASVPRQAVDEGFMRRVEGAVNVMDGDRPRFRQEVYRIYDSQRQVYGPSVPGLNSMPTLRVAAENMVLPSRDDLRLTLDPRTPDPGRQSTRQRIVLRLASENGYCGECAQELLDFSLRTLRGEKTITVREGRVSWE